MKLCPFYLYHAPPASSHALLVTGLSAFLLICVVGGISLFIKSRKAKRGPSSYKAEGSIFDITTFAIVIFISAFMLWAVVAGQSARLQFEQAIAANVSIDMVEGPISRIETMMAAPVASSRSFRRLHWTYVSARIDDVEFRFGRGSSNPGFAFFDQLSPPIVEGDYLRITHYRGRIIKIEKACVTPDQSGFLPIDLRRDWLSQLALIETYRGGAGLANADQI